MFYQLQLIARRRLMLVYAMIRLMLSPLAGYASLSMFTLHFIVGCTLPLLAASLRLAFSFDDGRSASALHTPPH